MAGNAVEILVGKPRSLGVKLDSESKIMDSEAKWTFDKLCVAVKPFGEQEFKDEVVKNANLKDYVNKLFRNHQGRIFSAVFNHRLVFIDSLSMWKI